MNQETMRAVVLLADAVKSANTELAAIVEVLRRASESAAQRPPEELEADAHELPMPEE